MTVQDTVLVEQVLLPGEEVTLYVEMGSPPVEAGAVQDTTD